MTATGNKMLRDICVGEEVFDVDSCLRKVTHVISRQISDDDVIYDVYVRSSSGTYGVIVADGKHRLLDADNDEIFVSDIACGDLILSSEKIPLVVVAKSIHPNRNVEIVDITVENSSRFWVVPFDVVEIEKDFDHLLCSIHIYCLDTDAAERMINDIQTCKLERRSRKIGLVRLGEDQTNCF
jgi:hypothetical protein